MKDKNIINKILVLNEIELINNLICTINDIDLYILLVKDKNDNDIIYTYIEYENFSKQVSIKDTFIGIKFDSNNMYICGKKYMVVFNFKTKNLKRNDINLLEMENQIEKFKIISNNYIIYQICDRDLKLNIKSANSDMIAEIYLSNYVMNYPICLINDVEFDIKKEKYDIYEKIYSVQNISLSELYDQIYFNEISYDKEDNKKINIKKLLNKLSNELINQKEAINELIDSFLIYRSGLKEDNKPIISVLFAGPTGVGKTETCRVLHKVLFNGNKKSYIRIDCSEYSSPHEVSKLIGAPPGYVGHENGTSLVSKIKDNPNSVVVFDEIEKAHPNLYDHLLQILEEGILTSGSGYSCDFSNCFVILTSNLGVKELNNLENGIGFNFKENNKTIIRKKVITNAITKKFRPEFINRLDKIIVFNDLSKNDLLKILDIHIQKINDKLSNRNIKVKFTDKVKKYIVNYNFNKNYGARPIKHNLRQLVYNKLAKKILNESCDGTTITVDYDNDIILTISNNLEVSNEQTVNSKI